MSDSCKPIVTDAYKNFTIFVLGENTCRACLSQDKDMKSLFSSIDLISQDEKYNILEMFTNCTSLDVNENDSYPKHICNSCFDELCEAFKFWNKCRISLNEYNEITEKIRSVEVKDDAEYLSDNSCTYSDVIKPRVKIDSDCDNESPVVNNNLSKNITTTKSRKATIQKKSNRLVNKNLNKSNNNASQLPYKCTKSSGTHKCSKCEIEFSSKAEYKLHSKQHNTYLCQECGHISQSKSNLLEHAATHSTLRPYNCKECDKSYKTISALNVHMKHHTGEQNYICNHCGKKFVTWSIRFSHIRSHHTAIHKHVCDICSKRFLDSNKLKIHKRVHTGEKPYACQECDMAFKSCSELKIHSVRHTGIRKYSCQICDKKFAKSSHVKQHMVIHTGERKYKCDICNKAFTQKHVLMTHTTTHNKERLESNLTTDIVLKDRTKNFKL